MVKVRLGWFVLVGVSVGLETIMEDHLCRDAVKTLLPQRWLPHNRREMQDLVGALVQIDSTLGITPCQYRAMKGVGQRYKEVSEADLLRGLQPGEIKVDQARAQAIQQMYDATASDHFSSNPDTWGYRVGAAIGAPIRAAAIVSARILNEAFEQIGDNIRDAYYQSLEIRQILYDDFEGLWYNSAGRWLDETGEIIDDVWNEGWKQTFGFFDGLAVGMFGPSAGGRRRVVYDKDCDMIMFEIDNIESECAKYRYERFQKLVKPLQKFANADSNVMDRRAGLNTSMVGDVLSVGEGLRVIFSNQREALYGLNGTCLHPNGTSLAISSSQLTNAVLQLNYMKDSVFDTTWMNLDRLSRSLINVGDFSASQLASGIAFVLNGTLEGYRGVRDRERRAQLAGLDLLTETLDDVSLNVNRNEEDFERKFANSERDRDVFLNLQSKKLDKSETNLRSVADMLDLSPSGLGRFTDALLDSGAWIMQTGWNMAQKSSDTEIKNFQRSKMEKLIARFADLTQRNLYYEQRDWTTAVDHLVQDYNLLVHRAQVPGLAREIERQFVDGSQEIELNIDSMKMNQSEKFMKLEMTSRDLTNAMKYMVSTSLRNFIASRDRLFDLVKKTIENKFSDTRNRISSILSGTSASVEEQMNRVMDEVSKLRSSVNFHAQQTQSALARLALRARHAVVAALMTAQRSAANKGDAMAAADAMARMKLGTFSDLWNALISKNTELWTETAEKSKSNIESSIDSQSSNLDSVRRNAGKAVAGTYSMMESGQNDALLAASRASAAVKRNDIAAGRASSTTARTAGNYLQELKDGLRMRSEETRDLRKDVSEVSRETTSSLRSLTDQLAAMNRDLVSDYASSTQYSEKRAMKDLQGTFHRTKVISDKALTDVMVELRKLNSTKRVSTSMPGSQSQEINDIAEQVRNVLTESARGMQRTDDTYHDGMFDNLRNVLASSQRVLSEGASGSTNLVGEILAAIQERLRLERFPLPNREPKRDLVPQSSVLTDAGLRIGRAVQSALKYLTSDSMSADSVNVSRILKLRDAVRNSIEMETAGLNHGVERLETLFTEDIGARVQEVIGEVAEQSEPRRWFETIENRTGNIIASQDENALSLSILSLAGQVAAALARKDRYENSRPVSVDGLDSLAKAVRSQSGFVEQLRDEVTGEYAGVETKAQSMITDLQKALEAVGISLKFVSKQSGAEEEFRKGVRDSQSKNIVNDITKLSNEIGLVVSESDSARDEALASVESISNQMSNYMTDLKKRIASSFDATSSIVQGNARFLDPVIRSDSNQVAIQRMLSKRAVGSLIAAWDQYQGNQVRKMYSINESDHEQVAALNQTLDTYDEKLRHVLTSATVAIHREVSKTTESLADYLKFQSAFQENWSAISHGVNLFNYTIHAGFMQMKEMINTLDANDAFMDANQRTDVQSMIRQFEADLDFKTNSTLLSVR